MFREIAGGLWLQPSLLYQTQCAVVRDRGGVTCVDPGFFEEEILGARALSDELRGGGPLRLALTHSDFDHIVGFPLFEDALVVASALWDEANEARARHDLGRFDEEHYVVRSRPLAGPVRRDLGIREDGEPLGEFACYLLQGHTRDGLALFHAPTSSLIVGDHLSDLEFPFIDWGALAYAQALEKLARIVALHHPAILVSQHGPPALGEEAIRRRLAESRAYMDALLRAAASEGAPEEVALRCEGSWRDGVPASCKSRHLENARMALRDLAGR